ncbi:D-ribose transporter ATP-binding protein [Paenibacillus sp. 32O-W]|uniref:sugar ABC transporter ATP-binding protein n=1 Tax=Paenibacillus sp. 32O-W TaxID=1695218 RepID=UPI00071EBB09|nr:sugar ABC transporter ATP-binding protein [Paenibacillus sp. 32O-W]ALS26445.1 D-ribose transporter ATP-binding protein [Paenibacillus sp. 32O-W]
MSLLKVAGLNKKFGQYYALSRIDFEIVPGEIHALVGENGAGKSTFIKIVTGVYAPDGGDIIWQGSPVVIADPSDARRIGINVVHQDRYLIPSFTGYENLYLGLPYPKSKTGIGVHWKQMRQRAARLMEEYGVRLDMNKTADRMSPPEKTMLEILRAMMLECKLLILDEPTASLTDQETEQLFALIRKLTEQGTAILYVSHRMDEIFRLSDRITVFRNGERVATVNRNETDKDRLISLMNNSEYKKSNREERAVPPGEPVLQVKELSTEDGKVDRVSLQVRQGEIVGIFGLAGAGRTELLEAIYGLRRISGGEIVIRGLRKKEADPRQSLDQGVVLIPEERKRDGLIMGMSIRENMTLPVLRKFSSGWKIRKKPEKAETKRWMEDMNVKASGTEQAVGQLSGGNQQKVVFAKALMSSPVLFLCDEPTQAVDIMTRDEIHRLLKHQADQGCAVLFVSSDLQEVLDISDRLYVLHEGRIAAELANRSVTPEQVLAYCFSQGKERGHQHG